MRGSEESKDKSEMISKSDNYWPIVVNHEKVCDELAAKIVEDGEGATRL